MGEPLNPDAYAYVVLQEEYRGQMDSHAEACTRASELRGKLERAEADALTAQERATSIMETLLKLEPPRDAEKVAQPSNPNEDGL